MKYDWSKENIEKTVKVSDSSVCGSSNLPWTTYGNNI